MPIVRRFLFLLLLSILPACAQLIQSSGGAASTTFTSCALPYSVTSGNILVVSSNWESSTSTPSVSDTLGTTFSQAAISTSGSVKIALYVGKPSSSGSDTITFTVSGSSFQNLRCAEFDGTYISNTVDVATAAASLTAISLTTTINGDTLIGSVGSFASNTSHVPADTSFDEVVGTRTDDSGALEYKTAGASGSYSVGFTTTGTSTGSMIAVALKPPSGVIVTSPAALPDAANATAYSYTLGAVGGSGAYTWSITSGSLPAGLSLSSGVISGTPTATTTNTFTVQASDGTNTGSKSVTLKVSGGLLTPSVVQHAAPGSSTNVVAFGSNIASGNLLVVVCSGGFGNGTRPLAVGIPTDTQSTPYQFLGSASLANGSIGWTTVDLFAGVASSSGADTVTCPAVGTLSDIANRIISVSEISGVGSLADGRSITTGSGVTSGTVTSGTITPTVASEVLFSGGTGYSGTSAVASPWTSAGAASQAGTGYKIVSSTSGVTVSYTLATNATSGTWGIVATGFRAAGDGTTIATAKAFMILQ